MTHNQRLPLHFIGERTDIIDTARAGSIESKLERFGFGKFNRESMMLEQLCNVGALVGHAAAPSGYDASS